MRNIIKTKRYLKYLKYIYTYIDVKLNFIKYCVFTNSYRGDIHSTFAT